MDEFNKQQFKDWVKARVEAVKNKYSAFDALIEIGVENLVDEETPIQVFCPFHHNVNTPAARYYPPSGRRHGNLRCFTCKENWQSIDIYAKAKGKRFMDALHDLELRYRIKIEKRPEIQVYEEPVERGSNYESDGWTDIPRVLELVEQKVRRVRDYCNLTDYIKFCRVIDAVSFDFDKTGKPTPEMSKVLRKLMTRIEESRVLFDIQDMINDESNDT